MLPPALIYGCPNYGAAPHAVQRHQIGMARIPRKSVVKDLASGLCIWHQAGGHGPATGYARTETIAARRQGEIPGWTTFASAFRTCTNSSRSRSRTSIATITT